jgi:hypothetical protein
MRMIHPVSTERDGDAFRTAVARERARRRRSSRRRAAVAIALCLIVTAFLAGWFLATSESLQRQSEIVDCAGSAQP